MTRIASNGSLEATPYSGPGKAMKLVLVSVTAMVLFFSGTSMGSDSDRQAKQEQLDAQCEAARERKLAPERAQFIEECVEKKQRSDRAACERFYSDYGAQSGSRAPLYYDLPACVEAFEYRNSRQQR